MKIASGHQKMRHAVGGQQVRTILIIVMMTHTNLTVTA